MTRMDVPSDLEFASLEAQEPLFRAFKWRHLPAHLQGTSMMFAALAMEIINTIPRSAERTVALRKLLESKDAAVRAHLWGIEDAGKTAEKR